VENLKLNIKSVDLDAASGGVWIEYDDKISFKIARANHPAYRSAVKHMHKQHRRQIDNGTMSEELSEKLLAELMAQHILVGWKGLKNNGKNFEYTVDNATAFLQAPQYEEIRDWIMMQAQDIENYRSEVVKK
jgi:hypothetical protein